jgi:hypothetical protein
LLSCSLRTTPSQEKPIRIFVFCFPLLILSTHFYTFEG